MANGKWKKLEKGIYEDDIGLVVQAMVDGRRITKRFDKAKRTAARDWRNAEIVRVKAKHKAAAATAPVSAPPTDVGTLTFAAYGQTFLALCPRRKGKHRGAARDVQGNDASMLHVIAQTPAANGQPMGPRLIGSLTDHDIEAVMIALRRAGRSVSTRNKYLTLFRLLSSWGVRKGYLEARWLAPEPDEASPDLFKGKGTQRDRRVDEAELRALMKAAPLRLRQLILAALATGGCRQGELMDLRWVDVSLARREVTIRDSKTGGARTLPIDADFGVLLKALSQDAKGATRPPTDYVFGNPDGTRANFPRRAWEATILKAHDITPHVTPTKALTPACRAALRTIDLDFHDLRHEAGSRLLERQWDLHHIQQVLGHANLAQTSTYLNAKRTGVQDAMRRHGGASDRKLSRDVIRDVNRAPKGGNLRQSPPDYARARREKTQ